MSDITFLVLVFLILLGWATVIALLFVHTRHDGVIIPTREESGKIVFTLELDIDPLDILDKDHVSFKVMPERPTSQ